MNANRLTAWTATTLVLTLVVQVSTAMAGPVSLVDDFSGTLAAYTATRILNNGNHSPTNTYNWQITNGKLEISTTNYVGIEQFALTRTDYTLGVGEELRGDWSAGYTGPQDVGLYVGAGHPTQDIRANYVNVYMRNNNQVFSRGFNGTTEFALSGGANVPTVTSLFIARTAVDMFELGYYQGATRTVITTRTIGSGNAAGIGNSIGAYADVRGAGIVGNLDNLRIAPEPTSWCLAMLGLVGLVRCRKRTT